MADLVPLAQMDDNAAMSTARMPTPGATVGGEYRIVRALSEGGMGAVFVAEQLSTGCERALKVMHPRLVEDPKLRSRFEQEARVGARIESDHVVQVVGAGIDGDTGMPWLAMELLKGVDLATHVRQRGALDTKEAVEVLSQLCTPWRPPIARESCIETSSRRTSSWLPQGATGCPSP